MSTEPRTRITVTEPSSITGRWIVYRPDPAGPIVTALVDESGWGWTYGFASDEPRFDVERQIQLTGFVVNVLFASGGSAKLNFSKSEPSTVNLATSSELNQWIRVKNESRERAPFTSSYRAHFIGVFASLIVLASFVIVGGWDRDPSHYLAALTPLVIWVVIAGYTDGVSKRAQLDARRARVGPENDVYGDKAKLQDALNAGTVSA